MNDEAIIMFISVKLCLMLCKGAMISKQWITKRKFNPIDESTKYSDFSRK